MYKPLLTLLVVTGLLIAHAQTTPKKTAQKPVATAVKKPVTKGKPAVKTIPKVSFTITGSLEGYSNYLVVLNKFRAHDLILIDSVRTNEKGEFTFKKTMDEASVLYIQYTQNTAVPLIVENGANIRVDIHPNVNGLNYDLSGIKSQKSLSLFNFIKKFSSLSNELGSLEQQIANEPDAMKSYQMQMVFAVKQQEYRMSLDTMLKFKSPLESYFVLFNFMDEQKPVDVKGIMTRMEPKDVKSSYYLDLKKIYDANKFLEIGELAPDIDLPQPDGTNLKLSALRGKIVLIDFWASWCGPCRAEFPNVKRIYGRFKEKGFEIYGVSLDREKTAWVNSISSLGLDWKHVSDLKYWSCAPAKVYKVSGIPFTVLVGKDGKILAKNLRGEELERKLEELFP